MKEFDLKIAQQNIITSIPYFFRNSITEMKRRFCYYLLSLISVIVVVCAAQITQTITDKSQLIYLRAGEMQNGQIDVRLIPNIDYVKVPFYKNRNQDRALFNVTHVNERLSLIGYDKYTAPRQTIDANVTTIRDNREDSFCYFGPTTPMDKYPEMFSQCSRSFHANLIFIDSEAEKRIEVGRTFREDEIPEDQAVISEEQAQLLNVKEGDDLLIRLSPTIYYFHLAERFCSQNPYVDCTSMLFGFDHFTYDIVIAVKIFKIVDSGIGKTSYSQSKSSIFMENKYLFKLLLKYAGIQLNTYLPVEFFKNNKLNYDINQYANQIVMNFPNRIDIYTQYDMDYVEQYGNKFAGEIQKMLGAYPVDIEVPLVKLFHNLKYAQMFLSIVTKMIIILFSTLSIMMLYNLLLVSVETKTYELGVLRIIGLNKIGVVAMILSQSLTFVLPGVVIGIILASIILSFVTEKFKSMIGIQIEQNPSLNSYALCLLLGMVIPLASSIIPIQRALSNSLSQALDKDRSKSSAVKITIDIEGQNIKWGQISFGLLCTLFGFSIYYLLPLSLFKMDLGLLISIFFFILIGLLVGLILICVNFSYIFERVVVFFCFFWVAASSKKVVLKNLACHRLKNTRTSIMYGLSIAFVIFVWSAMALQIDSQYYQKLQNRGANYVLHEQYPMYNVSPYEELLSSDLSDIVRSYSLVAGNGDYSLQFNGIYGVMTIKNKGQTINRRLNFVGLQSNYLKTTTEEYLKIDKKSSSGLDIVEELYASNSEIPKIIISKEYADLLFYNTDINLEDDSDNNYVFLEVIDNNKQKHITKYQVSAIVSSFPGFPMSNDIGQDNSLSAFVSLPVYYGLVNDQALYDGRYVFNKIIMDADLEHDEIIRKRFDAVDNYRIKTLWSFKNEYKELEQNMMLINFIFSALGLLVMIMCFFSLISSMTANIYEQTKEIAILRAVGLSRFKLSLIYIYESFVLVFSSCIMGTLVGLIIGYTMSMQRTLFTSMAIHYRFPWAIFSTQFIISIICAFASTIIPIRHLVNQPISNIIRKAM